MKLRSAFHLLVAACVALPLGRGGLCCCLLGGPDFPAAVAEARAAEPVRSCCDAAPAEEPASPEKPCDCPQRDDAVLAAAPSEPALAAVPSIGVAAPASGPVPAFVPVAAGVRYAGERPAPVPKLPRYRSLCALLC